MIEHAGLLERTGSLLSEPSQLLQENGVRIRTVCRHLGVLWLVLWCGTLPAQFIDKGADAEVLPQVPAGFQVTVFAREPLVRQPCSMAFDVRGRLFVGMGPQYRNPTPETPGDSVVIVTDADGDGVAETVKVFATGFNAVQGLAWRGRDLWVANAPDLTIVRDLDGDDEADEYVRVYTDLGNLEHGLHGLNWAPDGKLYMSKGNSKGLNRPGRYAPKPFRELWGMVAPAGTPDFPAPRTFRKGEYRHAYHDPADDWGLYGGVLRCDDGGRNLQIVSRGYRNPWDITTDSGFNWLGTDNDQTQGDRVFMPFFGAHFGWNHPWNAQWSDAIDAPTAPVSGPLFEGSGTGLVFYDATQFPEPFRRVFFINDWLRKTTFLWRPKWDGALLRPEGNQWETFVDGGKSLYRPTDIEVGPDGALWVLGWSRGYGAEWRDGKMTNEGRIFRISWKQNAGAERRPASRVAAMQDRSVIELLDCFAGPLPIWRTDAQRELIRRGQAVRQPLVEHLGSGQLTEMQETWVSWSLGLLDPRDTAVDQVFAECLAPDSAASLNLRIQAVRILAHRVVVSGRRVALAAMLRPAWRSQEPRLRLAWVQAVRQTGSASLDDALLELLATEQDRVTYYAAWQALRTLVPVPRLRELLAHGKSGVRRAALLGLLESDELPLEEVTAMGVDGDSRIRALVRLWLDKVRGGGTARVVKGPPIQVPIDRPDQSLRTQGGALATDVEVVGDGRYQVVRGGLRVGNAVYTDRAYRFVKIPKRLLGADIIRTANDDDASRGDDWLVCRLLMPVRVLVGVDTRQARPPRWLREGFVATGDIVVTDDCRLKLYGRIYPEGMLHLGGNTDDGQTGGKSNYVVVLEPLPAIRRKQETSVADALACLPRGDRVRGETLFKHPAGAGCSKCHSLGVGRNGFGPNLGGGGRRADARHIVTSILRPSAVITEGFRRQVVVTVDGKVHFGVLLEESGVSLVLGLITGQRLMVPKKTIEQRRTDEVSGMPVVSSVLSPQDVADLTTFLLAQRAAPESRPTGTLERNVVVTPLADRVRVTIAGKLFTEYHYRQCENPFLYPVIGPYGIGMTRNYPSKRVPGESQDHPHHTSVWFGHDGLNGVDFWRSTAPRHGRVVQRGIGRTQSGNDRGVLETVNQWIGPDGDVICSDQRRLTFLMLPEGRAIDWDITLRATAGDLTIADTEEGTMGIRTHPNLRLENGAGVTTANGQALNSQGVRGKAVWGQRAAWIDYWGNVGDKTVGIALFDHASNPRHPTWWHARPYGLFTANPFGIADFEGKPRGTGEMTIPTGKSISLHYRILFHAHDPERAGIKAAYERYGKLAKSPVGPLPAQK